MVHSISMLSTVISPISVKDKIEEYWLIPILNLPTGTVLWPSTTARSTMIGHVKILDTEG